MNWWLWPAFLGLLGVLAVLDLALFTRRPRDITRTDALASLLVWVASTIGCGIVIWYVYQHNIADLESIVSAPLDHQPLDGQTALLQFLTCYVLELALSLDNIAVLALVIAFIGIPREHLARTLFWSMLAGLVIRLGLFTAGATILESFPTFKWVFGALLAVAVVRVFALPDESTQLDKAWYVRWAKRILPVGAPNGQSLLGTSVVQGGKRIRATPMLLAVAIAATLDVAFTADSVPALFSVTKDPLLAFSACCLATLALRSIYFAFADVLGRFRYLKFSLIAILMYVAVKMFLEQYQTLPTLLTLVFVVGTLAIGILASMWHQRRHPPLAPIEGSAASDAIPTPLEDLATAAHSARRNLRKILILIGGTLLLVIGILSAPLPGPGPTILVPLALALLATEFIWAKYLLNQMKSGAFNISDRLDAFVNRTSIWFVPLIVLATTAVSIGFFRGILGLVWWQVAILGGSPLMPVLLWAGRYLRNRFWPRSPKIASGSDERSAVNTSLSDGSRPHDPQSSSG